MEVGCLCDSRLYARLADDQYRRDAFLLSKEKLRACRLANHRDRRGAAGRLSPRRLAKTPMIFCILRPMTVAVLLVRRPAAASTANLKSV